jgi:hypothetical protein
MVAHALMSSQRRYSRKLNTMTKSTDRKETSKGTRKKKDKGRRHFVDVKVIIQKIITWKITSECRK